MGDLREKWVEILRSYGSVLCARDPHLVYLRSDMKSYNSFLIRCWLIHLESKNRLEFEDDKCVIDIQHMQSGGHKRAATLTEIQEWMMNECRSALNGLEESSSIAPNKHGNPA